MTPRASRRTFCELGSAGLVAWFAGCGSADGEPEAMSGGSSTGGTTTDDPSGDPTMTSTNVDASSADGSTTSTTSDEATASESSAADTSSSGDDAGTTTGELCEPSPGSIEGPFYRPGIPIRSDLDLYGDAGNPVRLRGRVLDGNCAPVQDAIVELWHASPVAPGAMPGDDDATYDSGREFRYYGQVATDREGRYAFDTLKPGWYLNGAEYRPAHFHIKVWSGNEERLTSQLYFEDDPFNVGDPWFDPTMLLVLADDGTVERDFVI